MTTRCFALLALGLSACGPTAPAGDGDGGSLASADGGLELEHADASCGEQTSEIEIVEATTPDLLIVLDRSGSMSSPINPLNPFAPSKWSIMKSTLNSIATTYEAEIRMGLSSFPSDTSCGVAQGTDVDVDLNAQQEIATYLDDHGPQGQTPAHLALQSALAIFQSLPSNPAGQYVLFATDGVPNCVDSDEDAGDETVAAVEALAMEGIPTYVLGFGDIFGLDPGILDDAALAGGVVKAGGPPHYYHANSASDLEMALESIASGILVPSCSFEITEDPPDPDLVTVSLGGDPVPRDPQHESGWDYDPDDPGIITFYGDYCSSIQDGSAGEASFVFGCPGPTID